MMNSQTSPSYIKETSTADTIKLIAATALLIGAVFAISGCSAQNDGSVLKVQTGDKTLLDVKKNPDEKVSIDIEVPKVNLRVNQEPDVKQSFDYTTHSEFSAPIPPSSTDARRFDYR